MEIFIAVMVCMVLLAVIDLSVGVANDAVNFTNSAIGSKAAPRKIIFLVCTIGIIIGAFMSSGMMEVARKGLFNPQMFTLEQVFIIFLAVMITDIILLDFYNALGLPTSTTVSLVFEILGASFAVAMLKSANATEAFTHMNAAGAFKVISGIGISVIVAFVSGSLLQFLFRFIFSFKLHKTVKLYGGLFAGLSISSVLFFITISGLKSSDIIPKDISKFIESNLALLFLGSFVLFSIVCQVLILIKVNVFKIIILLGTGALALAFAGNDLVNFIGVPMAAHTAFEALQANGGNGAVAATVLTEAVTVNIYFLMGAAVVMILTLWLSKKAQTVTKTEINLSSAGDVHENFAPNPVARVFVKGFINVFEFFKKIMPQIVVYYVKRRFSFNNKNVDNRWVAPSANFDYLRATSNILIASFLIMIGTLYKLPLSTTFVTFMVAMGTSFSDRAWGREVAVYRVSGVLTVIGGWFLTAGIAAVTAGLMALMIYSFGMIFGIILFVIALLGMFYLSKFHKKRDKKSELQVEHFESYRRDPAAFMAKSLKSVQANFDDIYKTLKRSIENLESRKGRHIRELKQLLNKLNRYNETTQNMILALSGQNVSSKNVLLVHGISNIFGSVRHIVSITSRLRDNILILSETYYAKFSKSEYEELEDLLKVFDKLNEDFKEILKNDRFAPDASLVKDLPKKKRQIHEKQMQRIKDGKRKPRVSVVYLKLIDDMVALNESMDHLLNEVSINRKQILQG